MDMWRIIIKHIQEGHWCLFISFSEVLWGRIRATISSTGTTCSRAMHGNLREPQSDLQLLLTISNKDVWAAGWSILMSRVFHLLVSNPNLLPEEGWFGQPKDSTPSKKNILRCVGFCLHILPIIFWREHNTSPLLYLLVNPEAVLDSSCRSRRETYGLYKWRPCCDLLAESRIS